MKEGIGPKLPRPNRVRVPTRRELASYGIKLPSQREAEQRARQAERDPHYDDELLSDEEADAMEQDELARQFAATQQQRYGHRWEDDNATDDDDADTAAEAELARQFAATQQQRYAAEQPPGANPFSPADYEFSPMKTLVNEVRASRCLRRRRKSSRNNRPRTINNRPPLRNRVINLRSTSRYTLSQCRRSLTRLHRSPCSSNSRLSRRGISLPRPRRRRA